MGQKEAMVFRNQYLSINIFSRRIASPYSTELGLFSTLTPSRDMPRHCFSEKWQCRTNRNVSITKTAPSLYPSAKTRFWRGLMRKSVLSRFHFASI
ncbi:hypothetical protein HZ326_17593 [Fusarium oxysporum f. sp. albedinis]|nr:hypothetical protein HZ326_17593 [Fusarium oxysporum f. sp. albedinis]